ncbi:hypothetical protein B0T25DRAFT_633423 [Lasiosphaeria hispida]|uniref:Zn(2)-C6 fungal-type domain-containing protein n=1 Tax=Lasiosphaeria hispida TaxID=260671 RepID=A0AAJ0HG90_9PEZI|nr:hypothetical protein B0T25DRAFT_633423 [Lasiosphaeria hispida]
MNGMSTDMSESERRRRLPAVSCTRCRQRKVRCDHETPCNNCVKSTATANSCTYDSHPPPLPRRPRQRHKQPTGDLLSGGPSSTTIIVDHSRPSNSLEATSATLNSGPSPATSGVTTETAHSQVHGTFHIHRDALSYPTQAITRGVTHKARLFGQTHWINIVALLPARTVADALVDGYLRTTETVYRALHIPTSRNEYNALWASPGSPDLAFLAQLKLVFTIGAVTLDEHFSLRVPLRAGSGRHRPGSHPKYKSRLGIACLQTDLLLLLCLRLSWKSSRRVSVLYTPARLGIRVGGLEGLVFAVHEGWRDEC